jgi:hypothetical protein
VFRATLHMSHPQAPSLVEITVLAIGIVVAGVSGVLAYGVVGLYGDGPFAHGYHRERDPATGQSLLVQDIQTSQGRVRRVIAEGRKVIQFRIDKDADGVEDARLMVDGTTLTKTGFSLAGDGVIDAWAIRDAADQVVRIEVSTKRDGRVDRWEHYTNGKMVRVELDTDRNGRADRWQLYEDGILMETVIDANEDGQPDVAPAR